MLSLFTSRRSRKSRAPKNCSEARPDPGRMANAERRRRRLLKWRPTCTHHGSRRRTNFWLSSPCGASTALVPMSSARPDSLHTLSRLLLDRTAAARYGPLQRRTDRKTDMCFSASASLAAGTLLLGLGTVTMKAARRPGEWPFAAVPLLFAIQQFIEGTIWLSFSHDAA